MLRAASNTNPNQALCVSACVARPGRGSEALSALFPTPLSLLQTSNVTFRSKSITATVPWGGKIRVLRRDGLVFFIFFPHGTVFIKNKQTGRDLITSRLLVFPEGATARAAAERRTRYPRLIAARSLIIFICFAVTPSLIHEITGRHRLPFSSCGSPLSNSLRLTPLPSGHADWWMHAQVVAWPTASSAASRPPYPGRKARASAGKHVLCSTQARLPPPGARRARGRVRGRWLAPPHRARRRSHPLEGGRPRPLLASMPGTQAS